MIKITVIGGIMVLLSGGLTIAQEADEGSDIKKANLNKHLGSELQSSGQQKSISEKAKTTDQQKTSEEKGQSKKAEEQKGPEPKTGEKPEGKTDAKKVVEAKLFKKVKVVNQMKDRKVQVFLNEEEEGKGFEVEIEKGKGEQESELNDNGIEVKSLRVVVIDDRNRTVDSGKKPITWTNDKKVEIKNILKEQIQDDQIKAILEAEQGDKGTLLITLELVPMNSSMRDNMR